MRNSELYDLLGVSSKASEDEIKKAYRKMALKYHPDKWVDKPEAEQKKAEEKFKQIGKAYRILLDKDKRRQYDMFGTTDDSVGNSADMDAGDLFSQFMNAGFGSFRYTNKAHAKGTDKKLKILVTVEEVLSGGSKDVSYDVEVKCERCNGSGSKTGRDCVCPHCNGTGQIVKTRRWGGGISQEIHACPYCNGSGYVVEDPCPDCNGTGTVKRKVTKSFTIPPIDGLRYTYKAEGEGNCCHNNRGGNGDLYFTFAIKDNPNDKFRVDELNNANIITDIDVSVFDCITGCEKTVVTPDGRQLKARIPQGTKDGYILSFNGYGFRMSNGGTGNLIARVNMTMPSLTDEQIKKVKLLNIK